MTTALDALPERESAAGVLGLALGFLVILACVFAVLSTGPRHPAADEVLGGSFVLGSLPEGLSLEAEALVLSTGESIVTLTDGDPLEVSMAELVRPRPTHGMEQEKTAAPFEEFDWAGVTVESRNGLPARLFLVHFPERRAEALLNSQFRGLEWKDLLEIDVQGGSSVVGGGKLEWFGFDADWVRQRRFIVGGSFRDTMRVNLSLGHQCWVAYAIWRQGAQASEEVMGELLAALAPVGEGALEELGDV